MTADLRERILSGSGPDRELDALVWCALHPGSTAIIDGTHIRAGCDVSVKQGDGEWFRPPPLTACPIGAGHCLALVGEVLPGWSVHLSDGPEFGCSADLWNGKHGNDLKEFRCDSDTDLCRALLAAILDAKAQEAS